MKYHKILAIVAFSAYGMATSQAQTNGNKTLDAIGKCIAGLTFSDQDAANIAQKAVAELDAKNTILPDTDPLSIRLNKLFENHKTIDNLSLNFKVYRTKDINAFACADGSIRVYSGLMQLMDDNELLAVIGHEIGHEIGHIVNHDTKDAVRAAYQKEAVLDLLSSQNDKIAAITKSQWGVLANQMIDCKHSRSQESEADLYSYDFLKKNGYNVNALASAFEKLAKNNKGNGITFLERMLQSHPDPQQRAVDAKKRAQDDGLYQAYHGEKQVSHSKSIAKKKSSKKKRR